jgi:hypothetical protein
MARIRFPDATDFMKLGRTVRLPPTINNPKISVSPTLPQSRRTFSLALQPPLEIILSVSRTYLRTSLYLVPYAEISFPPKYMKME